MKLINPIGRSVQQAESGAVQPRGCTCNTTVNNFTAMRKVAGSCSKCYASCQGHTNGEANATVAQKKNRY